MRTRTDRLNRYYHAHLQSIHEQAVSAKFNVQDFDTFKQAMKGIDPLYPKENDIPISTANLTNKELCDHIEFVLMTAGTVGITSKITDAEWNRLLQQVRTEK